MPKKLPPHITKVDNKYRVRYRKSNKYPIDYNEYFNTIDEAISASEKFEAKCKLNLLKPKEQNIGFTDFCTRYLEWFKNKQKKPSYNTIRGYKTNIKQLINIFKNENIKDIDTYRIELELNKEKNRLKISNNEISNAPISDYTLHHEFTMLRILFNKAASWGFIDKNPMLGVEEPTYKEKKIAVPEYEQLATIESLINSCGIRERCQFLLGLYTGMREEEVCGLHLDDFNFDEKYVSINRAVVYDSDRKIYVEDKTKSQSSVRKLPLPDEFFPVLEKYYQYRKIFIDKLKLTHDNYIEIPNVFLNKNGEFYRPHRLSRTFSMFSKKNHLNLTFHGLRHYYLTNQMNYNDNLSPRDVQELAGHANINTTYKYVHSSENRIKNNATKVFNKFSEKDLYKNGNDIITIPISHVATIILGNPNFSKIEDLKITLNELSSEKVNFFNISEIIITTKQTLLNINPILYRMLEYQNNNISEMEILYNLEKDFGKEIKIKKQKIMEKDLNKIKDKGMDFSL